MQRKFIWHDEDITIISKEKYNKMKAKNNKNRKK